MTSYVVYVEETGQITGSAGGCVVSIPGAAMLPGAPVSGNDFYITRQTMTDEQGTIAYNPTVTPRPVMPIVSDKTSIPADSKTAANITGIPNGATVIIEGETHTIDDGEVQLTADHVGDYVMKFTLFPYKSFYLTITGTAT